MSYTNVHILGDGVTGKAVREKVNELEQYAISDVNDADIIVASPGIPPYDYPKTDTPIISEIEFAFQLFHRPESTYQPKLICTTGTNGKTTLTSLLSHCLGIPAAGNIGTPLIHFVDKGGADWIAVELSSYQLYACNTFRPDIAIMLPISDDHLNWHQKFEHYVSSKLNIFLHQKELDTLIYPAHCPYITEQVHHAKSTAIPYSINDQEIQSYTTQLEGPHNKLNVLAATKAISLITPITHEIKEKLASFTPLPHRLEKIYEKNGIRIYNDSKSTNPDSTMKAIESFSTPIRLLLCGNDKGLNIQEFMAFLHGHVAEIIVFGDLSETIVTTSETLNPNFPVTSVSTMDAALQLSLEHSNDGDIILFSPSSSSFDLFSSYIERGNAFKTCVQNILET